MTPQRLHSERARPCSPLQADSGNTGNLLANLGLRQASPRLGSLVFLDVVERLLDRLRLDDVAAIRSGRRLGTI